MALGGTGCTYDEKLPTVDLQGTIRLPRSAMQVTLFDEETREDRVIEDIRALGPVYIGAFPDVRSGDFAYDHPEMGPITDADYPGNTYPYGGTSKGRFDFGCYQSMVCKMVTGRYSSYDDVLEFFRDVVKDPVTDAQGEEVTNGDVYRETCYDEMYITSDEEVAFLARTPDFHEEGDYLVADVTMLHVNWVEGMKLWGWVDMPSRTFDFSTCDDGNGVYYSRYSESYYEGTNASELINFPSLYIDEGDFVSTADGAPTITDPDQPFELNVEFQYVE